MNKIYKWAIENAPEIDRDTLAYLVNQLDDPVAERLTNALLGLVDVGQIYAGIPGTVPDTEYYRNLRFKSYNYLQDDVTVTCDARYTRYFPTKEEAEAALPIAYELDKVLLWLSKNPPEKLTEHHRAELKLRLVQLVEYARTLEDFDEPLNV